MFDKWFWKLKAPAKHDEMLRRVMAVSPNGLRGSWYYYFNFGCGVEVRPDLKRDKTVGTRNWQFILEQNLPIKGNRVLNIGCNAGLYDLYMNEMGARETVGIEADPIQEKQAEFYKIWRTEDRGVDYANSQFICASASEYDLSSLGTFDLVTLFCVAYHIGDGLPHVMDQLTKMTPTIALQGNLPRVTNPKYANRPHQELAGVPGMTALLEKYGYTDINVIAPTNYIKPLVIGSKP